MSQIKILYQDNDLVVCIKPAGVLSTEAPGGMPELLRQELHVSDIRSVHRLDRVTAGSMVYALNSNCAAALSQQITSNIFQKEYLAVVHGIPSPTEGRMTDLLFRESSENKSYVVQRMRKGVKEAVLDYKTCEVAENLSLEQIHLITGRTHQIRAQFSHRKMPLWGDRKYGAPGEKGEIALWSYHIEFQHPKTKKTMKFETLPPAFAPWTLFEAYTDSSNNEYAILKEHSEYIKKL